MLLSAGVVCNHISPPVRIYLIGNANRIEGTRSVHDNLAATALALDDGLHRARIVACDLYVIKGHTTVLIQAQTSPNVVICCSNTHSGSGNHAGQCSPH